MMKPSLNQRAEFAERGWTVVGPLVGAAELEQLRDAFRELMERWARESQVTADRYQRAVSQWTNVWEQHEAFDRQLRHPAVASVARELMGVDRVQLFHDHVISKPPARSGVIPWHQDYPFWPLDAPRALSCWLALDDADADSGAMWFMPGAQLEGECPPQDFLATTKDWGSRAGAAVPVDVPAGHAVFHSCLSWHRSGRNMTERMRRAYICILMDSECRYDPDHSGWHPMNDRVTVRPGERFNADAFPRLGALPTEVA